MAYSLRIVLVETSHPGNIGASARAMKTMGFDDLVLVAPGEFPSAEATARASGADELLKRARVVSSLSDAIADCAFVAGASARSRSLAWPTVDPRSCAATLHERLA
ncbi:MAG TPA: TrmH family RNA methyltransferase, partial [Gammaproteobacteria bacterium]